MRSSFDYSRRLRRRPRPRSEGKKRDLILMLANSNAAALQFPVVVKESRAVEKNALSTDGETDGRRVQIAGPGLDAFLFRK